MENIQQILDNVTTHPGAIIANVVRTYVRTHKYQNSNVVRMPGILCGSLSIRKTTRREAGPRTHQRQD